LDKSHPTLDQVADAYDDLASRLAAEKKRRSGADRAASAATSATSADISETSASLCSATTPNTFVAVGGLTSGCRAALAK
jgi:hypothetical protein